MSIKKAVFAGTFDPFTIGHEEIINKALTLFDEIVILIAINPTKKQYSLVGERLHNIQNIFFNNHKIKVDTTTQLTVDYCKENNIEFLIRGLRNANDLEYEKNVEEFNKNIDPTIHTFYVMCSPENSLVSSTLVRYLLENGKDVSKYIPKLK